jgi:hypothetical protein
MGRGTRRPRGRPRGQSPGRHGAPLSGRPVGSQPTGVELHVRSWRGRGHPTPTSGSAAARSTSTRPRARSHSNKARPAASSGSARSSWTACDADRRKSRPEADTLALAALPNGLESTPSDRNSLNKKPRMSEAFIDGHGWFRTSDLSRVNRRRLVQGCKSAAIWPWPTSGPRASHTSTQTGSWLTPNARLMIHSCHHRPRKPYVWCVFDDPILRAGRHAGHERGFRA